MCPIRRLFGGGGCSSCVMGCWQRGSSRNAARLQPLASFPVPCCDQPLPGHARLVLSGFGRRWGSVWVEGPSPHVRFAAFGGVGGSSPSGQWAALPAGSPDCPDVAGTRGSEPS